MSDRSEPTGEKERREPVTTGIADASVLLFTSYSDIIKP